MGGIPAFYGGVIGNVKKRNWKETKKSLPVSRKVTAGSSSERERLLTSHQTVAIFAAESVFTTSRDGAALQKDPGWVKAIVWGL